MDFLKLYQHLLPDGRAWRTTIDKRLRQFFQGLSGIGVDVKDFADKTWLDVFPETTRELDAWERQWGLPSAVLTDQERRDRLDGAWKAQGGQSPRYIQDTLQNAGFNVFVHHWWQLPFKFYAAECGEPAAECGEPTAECGAVVREELGRVEVFAGECGEVLAECGEAPVECGNVVDVIFTGLPIPRNPFDVLSDSTSAFGFLLSCNASGAICGASSAICGASTTATGKLLVNLPANIIYNIPTDDSEWPFILYLGGETFGQKAQVDLARKDEFEALCLKICPTQQWIGLIVEFS